MQGQQWKTSSHLKSLLLAFLLPKEQTPPQGKSYLTAVIPASLVLITVVKLPVAKLVFPEEVLISLGPDFEVANEKVEAVPDFELAPPLEPELVLIVRPPATCPSS